VSIRQSLLAILSEGACYGNQLRLEYEKRTGGSVNVGQVYSTLDRLERDGLVTKTGIDSLGHVLYELTGAGGVEGTAWLAEAVGRSGESRDEFLTKLALALTLPAADAASLIAVQRASTTAALTGWRAELEGGSQVEPRIQLVRRLIVDSRIRAAQAELDWLDECERVAVIAVPFGLDSEPPRRGRPIRHAE